MGLFCKRDLYFNVYMHSKLRIKCICETGCGFISWGLLGDRRVYIHTYIHAYIHVYTSIWCITNVHVRIQNCAQNVRVKQGVSLFHKVFIETDDYMYTHTHIHTYMIYTSIWCITNTHAYSQTVYTMNLWTRGWLYFMMSLQRQTIIYTRILIYTHIYIYIYMMYY